mgnify:CR=1 FL=1
MKLFEHALAPLITVALAAVSLSVIGASVRHEAHVHGVAELTLMMEGDNLNMIFTSPAMSRVGLGNLPFNLNTIHAMWVSDRGQSAAVLTPNNQLIELN